MTAGLGLLAIISTCLLPPVVRRPATVQRSGSPIALARRGSESAQPAAAPPSTFDEMSTGKLSQELGLALEQMGLTQPMESQYLSWPMLRGASNDVALVAEAGSGKTLAYLLPLIDEVLHARRGGGLRRVHVVVPTHDLVRQVVKMATELCAATSLSVCAAEESRRAGDADVVVGTPADTLAAMRAGGRAGEADGKRASGKAGRGRGRGRDKRDRHATGGRGGRGGRTRTPLTRDTDSAESSSTRPASVPPPLQTTVVLDEADFLLAGVRSTGKAAISTPTAELLDTLRKRSKPAPSPSSTPLSPSPSPSPSTSTTSSSSSPPPLSPPRPPPPPSPPPPRVVFVSATVPGQGASSLGAYLDKRFPSLSWVRSSGAHRPLPNLCSEYLPIADDAARAAALVQLCDARDGRTLVFANSASRAADAVKILTRHGLSVDVFHPKVAKAEREASLERFARSRKGLLVASGLAARGLDVPNVALVVEYQMAPNVVEHMHRVGRTARAGRPGRAVSLVNEHSANEQAMMKEIERCRAGGWKFI